MISKILSIKGIGKFDKPFRAVDLEEFTVIFAENGRGKSMLAAILRSLSAGKPEIIMERHTLGSNNAPEVSLLANGSNSDIVFRNTEWNTKLPNIEVFDAEFVSNNVYSGDSIELEHKRNLYRFVLGSHSVVLAKQVDELDKDSRSKQKAIRERKKEIQRLIVGDISISEFLKLQPVSDSEIERKNTEVEALKESQSIISTSRISLLQLPKIPYKKLVGLLSKSLPDISKEAEIITLKHIEGYLDDEGQDWLESGLSYVRSDTCPFCGQSVIGNELIEAYRSYFDEAYTAFKFEISTSIEAVDKLLAEDKIRDIQHIITTNDNLADFWSEYVPTNCTVIEFDTVAEIWDSLRSSLISDLKRKENSPLEELELSQSTGENLKKYELLQAKIKIYNDEVRDVNKLIDLKKSDISTGNLAQALDELELLKLRQVRFRDGVAELCREYETLRREKRELVRQKTDTKERLNHEADSLLGKYQKAINRYLTKCGAGFRIADARTNYPGGKPSAGYYLEINEKQVKLGTSEVSEGGACFRNTLSEGDKSTLAFAFFLAKLDQDRELCKKVVVFDDPVSSLDANRRQFTRDQIVRISKIAQQVVVLTHDLYLARRVWDGIKTEEKCALQIKRAGKRCSIIAPWDLDSATRGEYYRNYHILADYLENSYRDDDHLRTVARCIRPLLEGNLRMRFPESSKDCKMLGQFLGKIRDAQEGDPLFRLKDQYEEISNINDYSKKYHHSQNLNADNEQILDSELESYVERTLNVIGGIMSS